MPATPPKAFTLIELVVVIVILGILAAIAVVGYSSVTSRSRQEQVRQAAYAFDLEYRSLLALDGSVNYADITPAVPVEIDGVANTAQFSQDGAVACLTLPTTLSDPVVITNSPCA